MYMICQVESLCVVRCHFSAYYVRGKQEWDTCMFVYAHSKNDNKRRVNVSGVGFSNAAVHTDPF
jgi:hypothetical protein